MKFGAKKRIQAYKYCVEQLKKHYPNYNRTTGPYICNLLGEWAKNRVLVFTQHNIPDYFPEFFTCKGTHPGENAWFGDESDLCILTRLIVLQYCIEVCEYEIQCATA